MKKYLVLLLLLGQIQATQEPQVDPLKFSWELEEPISFETFQELYDEGRLPSIAVLPAASTFNYYSAPYLVEFIKKQAPPYEDIYKRELSKVYLYSTKNNELQLEDTFTQDDDPRINTINDFFYHFQALPIPPALDLEDMLQETKHNLQQNNPQSVDRALHLLRKLNKVNAVSAPKTIGEAKILLENLYFNHIKGATPKAETVLGTILRNSDIFSGRTIGSAVLVALTHYKHIMNNPDTHDKDFQDSLNKGLALTTQVKEMIGIPKEQRAKIDHINFMLHYANNSDYDQLKSLAQEVFSNQDYLPVGTINEIYLGLAEALLEENPRAFTGVKEYCQKVLDNQPTTDEQQRVFKLCPGLIHSGSLTSLTDNGNI